ncbi:MAG: tyrosine-type recombinase/integrase [Verrucomicrobiales bacterium]
MRSEILESGETAIIPPRKTKPQGIGSRKGNAVTLTKWKHRFYKWRVRWIEGGRTEEKGFKRKAEAEEWAEKKEKELLDFGVGATMGSEERSAVLDTREDLKAVGMSLREAVAVALELRRKELRSITVGELVPKLIADRESAGRSERYVGDLRSRLGRFQTDFGNRSVATITRDEITEWIRGLNQSATSQNNYLRLIRVLFSEAVKGKYLDENPARHVTESKAAQTEVGTLTPEELAAVFEKAPEELIPVIAIGAFAGIRREEIKKLDWSDVDLTHNTIRVRPAKAKSARNRLVPIEPNLAEWLRPRAQAEGRVWCEGGDKKFTLAMRAAGFGVPGTESEKEKKAGWKFRRPYPENGLRHSYATYWLAEHQDSGALSLNLGHTNSRIVFDHYRAPMAAERAKAYWSIRPGKAENVIAMNRKEVA